MATNKSNGREPNVKADVLITRATLNRALAAAQREWPDIKPRSALLALVIGDWCKGKEAKRG